MIGVLVGFDTSDDMNLDFDMNLSTANSPAVVGEPWQAHLKTAIRDTRCLLAAVGLTTDACALSDEAVEQFPVRVPLGFVARMERGNSQDPLLLQVLSQPDEMLSPAGYAKDPLDEQSFNPTPGLIHKYRGRALLMPTEACAVNCRYCFRRHFSYESNRLDSYALQRAIEYLRSDSSIFEVILSGGDPLLLDDDQLEVLVTRLQAVPQLKRLRIHSRTPVVIPERLTKELGTILRTSIFDTVLVIHCNHSNELDATLKERLLAFKNGGITLLNQSVLLRGVNDSVVALVDLSERLFEAGVLPYYLHQLDPVIGAAHFAVDDKTAKLLHDELSSRLPGYLVPDLVRELAGSPGKTRL